MSSTMSVREAQAELGAEPRREHHRLRVVAVHVQDRRLHRLGDVGAVEAGIGVRRHGGEADLVVGDDVDRAAGAVADELAHRHGLVDHALAGEGGVAVQQDAHHGAAALGVARHVLPRAHLADHHRVHRLQVAGFGCSERCTIRPAISMSVEVPRWYFTSPEPCTSSGLAPTPLNSAKTCGEGLLHHVDQHVQPAAMRHADGDLLHAAPAPRSRSPSAGPGWCSRRPPARSAWWRRIRGRRTPRSPRPRSAAPGWRAWPSGSKARGPGRALDPLLDPGLLVRRPGCA